MVEKKIKVWLYRKKVKKELKEVEERKNKIVI
jgi:hypothetical protein